MSRLELELIIRGVLAVETRIWQLRCRAKGAAADSLLRQKVRLDRTWQEIAMMTAQSKAARS
jgi:hypothetical protein